ncbi:MAG: 2Fe-2S iron-sulfur cluster binding domain-containing protein, partial [bacterium]|nr:2Fe-2S iron-sulfur cluster binding domain-containing protein [bacterium]
MIGLQQLEVNDQIFNVAVESGETLLDVLREKLHLTGTKKGCNVGDCGACAAAAAGLHTLARLVVARDSRGRPVTTIEGLAQNGELTPIQKAFVHEGGLQCGYCTPGMVLSATALLDKHPQPDSVEIKEALSGN